MDVSWTIKKAEYWRINAFELWCWRGVLRVLWTARRWNHSILKEISPEFVHWKEWRWSRSSGILATWWEKPTHWKRPWCWERLSEGRGGGRRGWDGWMASSSQWMWLWARSGIWGRTGKPGVLQTMGPQRGRHDWVNEEQQDSWWMCHFKKKVIYFLLHWVFAAFSQLCIVAVSGGYSLLRCVGF